MTWRAGQVVLKPADSARAALWFADVCCGLNGPGFRVPRPVPAVAGDWVALGWTCWQWVAGVAAVIDFSPLERPAALPLAIAAVDGLQWGGALPEVLGQFADEPEFGQLMARALIYRHVAEIVMRAGTPGIETIERAGQPVTDLIVARLTR